MSRFLALDLALETADLVLPMLEGVSRKVARDLATQGIRAMGSTCLRLAEGWGRSGADRMHMIRTAYASCRETVAALRLLLALGAIPRDRGELGLAKLDEVAAVTWRLHHPR